MKHIVSVIIIVGVLVAGSALPAEARGGRGGGFHGGGGKSHGGSFRGGHGFHGSAFRGGKSHGGSFRGGHGFHGSKFQSGRFHGRTRVFIGGGVGWWGWPGWSGPGWWGAPYPAYAAPPVVIQPPTEYIQPAPAPPAQDYWYYCQSAGMYYPYVKECPGGWMQVVPQPAPPDR